MHVSASWFNPFVDLVQRARRRRAARDLHLLGLGLRRRRQRGVGGVGRGARPRRGRLDAPARAHLRRRLDRGAGIRRHRRRSETNSNDVLSVLGNERLRLAVGQAADHRRAHVGVRVDADDDPAHRADDAVDGALGRDPEGVREHPPALPDADRLDARHGRALDRLDGPARRAEPGAGRPRRLDHGARLLDLLLLRLHRARVRVVLPARPVHERAPLLPRRAAAARRRRADVRRLREGVPRLQPARSRLLEAAVGDPDADRDRDRDAAARACR